MSAQTPLTEAGAASTLWRAVRHRWWIIAAVLIPWTLLASAYVLTMPPQYSAVSVVSIVPDGPEAASGDFISATASRYAVAMTSTSRLRGISQDTGVPTEELQDSVTVDTTAPGANIKVTATFDDPQTAMAVANAVADNAVSLGDDSEQLSTAKVSSAVLQDASLMSSRSVLLAVLLMAGGALSLWVAFVVQRLRPVVRDEEDVERASGVPSLVAIDGRLSTPHGADAQIAALRQAQALQLALQRVVAGSLRQVTFIGVGTSDGTAIAAHLLAKTLSTGNRVLLIDADVGSAALSRMVDDINRSSLSEALEAGRSPSLPSDGPGVLLLAQPDAGQGVGGRDVDADRWTQFLEGAAREWDKVVLAAPVFDGDGEFRQRPLPSSNAVLVVPEGASASGVSVAARRIRRIHGDLRGAMLFTGRADS